MAAAGSSQMYGDAVQRLESVVAGKQLWLESMSHAD